MDNLTNSEQGKLSYQLLDRENPVFGTFIVWSSILVLKFLFMSFLTAFQRFKTKVCVWLLKRYVCVCAIFTMK